MKMTQIDFVLCLLLSTIRFWSGYKFLKEKFTRLELI